MDISPELINTYLSYAAMCAGAALLLALVMLVLAFRAVRRIDIPPNANLTTTLRAVPIYVVLAIDLLDLALDIFAVPIVWVVLDRMNLRALRNVSSIEVLIPFTGPIPTMTIAWVLVRMGLNLS